MRSRHLVASVAAAALAVAARPGAARADDAERALVSRPFSLGDVSIQRAASTALRIGRFDCVSCTDPDDAFPLVAWDLSVTLPLSEHAALFVLQPILFRGKAVATGPSHRFPGALTVGVRHVATVGSVLDLAAAGSVSLPYPGAGGEAAGTTQLAGEMIADRSLYTAALGTLRVELDARVRWSALFAQAQLAVAAHSTRSDLFGDSRAGLGAGVQILGRAAILAELTGQLGGGALYCFAGCDPPRWDGPGRPAVSLGASVAIASWTVGARWFWQLTEPPDGPTAPSVSVTAGARF